MAVVLEGRRVSRRFGGLPALQDVSFEVNKGEIFGLIGPNGAGKSTLLSVVSGMLRPTSGTVLFNGRDLAGLGAHRVCRLGVARVLQTPRPFGSMTVLENVMVGALFGGRDRTGADATRGEHVSRILELLGLREKERLPVAGLTLQDKRTVEMARALATVPEVLLLDEPMAGLDPAEVEHSMGLVRRIRDELGVTIVWIEHVMKAVMGVAERVMVLNYGRVIALGSPAEVAGDERVIDAYLGRA
ncbi:MAG: ABC transporter ATP-binding protein [Chloroflexota bacterium]|nr:ABC transporter ATP-binding protein [Chloroflexota bacterium]MDE3102653.1 ABC transporter ATP-binding protein [Chloroflexota bacterium]